MIPSGRGFTVLAGAAAIAVVAVTSWSLASRQTAAPSSVAVAVTARPVAPAVHGWLTYDRAGGQAMLAVTGLPGAGQVTGRDGVYEVWFIRPDGSTQPAGYLSQSPDGTWTAALRGDMSGYSAVAATAEPLGGSRSPTGPEVLQAPLS
jgi:anti-sigma-K factor RskA